MTTPDTAPFRVGLVGYGLAGESFHAPFIATTPGLRLDAIVTGNPDRQRAVTRAHPAAIVVESASRLWERADKLDLVVIASPNRTHVPLAMEALAHGLHVVVDKPFATRASDARALVAEANRRDRLITVFQNRRWDGDFLTVQRLLSEETLGQAYRFESRFERWRPTPRDNWRERGAPDEAGGLLFDLGSHLIDQALVLFGPAAHVYAELDLRRVGVQTDDDSFVGLTHANGVRSHLFMSAVAAQSGPRFRLLGSRGAFVKWGLDPQEAKLRAGQSPDAAGFGDDPEGHWGTLGAGDEVRAIPTERGAYRRFYEGMVDALRGVGPPPVSPHDAIAALAVIEAARRSSAERRVIAVSDDAPSASSIDPSR